MKSKIFSNNDYHLLKKWSLIFYLFIHFSFGFEVSDQSYPLSPASSPPSPQVDGNKYMHLLT